MSTPSERAVVGCILGTAVGDALGLCAEGMSPRRQRRVYPDMSRYNFFLGRGMTSDDTEHTCLTAQALLISGGEPARFARSLAWRLRWWLLGLPLGMGRATLRATVRLWLGFPPHRSGVHSAGNGPAMRSALLGVRFGGDVPRLKELVRVSTRLTHTDPRAEHGALAVAWAAHLAATLPPGELTPSRYCADLRDLLGTEGRPMVDLVERARESAEKGQTTSAFVEGMGLKYGVTGFINHTVPAVLHAWFRHSDDLRAGLVEIVTCGGDSDTTGAILGGILGARVGKEGIPREWLDGLWEWPRSVAWLECLGKRLADPAAPRKALGLNVPGLVLRNLFFFVPVLLLVLRRLLPPY
jgi:ADP-ribosyl-[dinitrogen reductase] hydrolase